MSLTDTTSAQTYPDILNVGDRLFPMLYIFYMGDQKYTRLIGSAEKFDAGLSKSLQYVSNAGSENLDEVANQIYENRVRYHQMLTSAAEKNKIWLFSMNNAIVSLMEKYKSRIPQIKGAYYEGVGGKGTSYTPILNPNDSNNLYNMMECLRLMYENDLLPADYDMGTRPISLYTSQFSDQAATDRKAERIDRLVGLPSVGQFTLNDREIKPIMGRTFTGVDMKIIVSLNNSVTTLKTMTSLSWSVHRGKPTGRPMGRPAPRGRAGGSRTVAGTMIFAAADHEPLLDIIPEGATTRRQNTLGWNKAPYRKVVMPDQLPPFDIMVIMSNEYGTSAITSIYGIEIVDFGGENSVNNLMTEHVYQYTAVAMDPLVEAYPDENGYFDPYGILQGGYSEMWFKKEAAMEGLLYSDLEDGYLNLLLQANQGKLTGSKTF